MALHLMHPPLHLSKQLLIERMDRRLKAPSPANQHAAPKVAHPIDWPVNEIALRYCSVSSRHDEHGTKNQESTLKIIIQPSVHNTTVAHVVAEQIDF
jgi:hypothetical protein